MSRQVYGKYELMSRIATGGMAEVWLGRSSSIGGFEKHVALKRLHPRLVKTPGLVSLFIEEAKLSVALTHPNIVHVFDFGEVDGDYYIAMEYVDGLDLATLARRAREGSAPLPVGVSVFVVRQVLEGLAHAHGNKKNRGVIVIHRDVSPHNVLVSWDGQVKLSDFGIAKAIGTAGGPDGGQVVGKSAYMSPEQARGESVTAATDLWSVGVVLHELLTGARLFVRETEEATLAAVERDPINPPSASNPHVPPALDEITMALLERDPAKRPENARKAAEILSAILREHYPTVDDYRVAELLSELSDMNTLIPGTMQHIVLPVEGTAPGRREADDDLVLAFEHTSPGLVAPPPEVAELKKVFAEDPSLWVLYDIGEAYAAAQQLTRALGAMKTAMAKFAQAGLLVQAVTIATRVLELAGRTERTLNDIKRLPTLHTLTDAQFALAVFDPSDESADYAEFAAMFRRREPTKSQIPEAQIFAPAAIFSALDGEQLLRLIDALRRQELPAATRILTEGELGTTFFWIGRGRVVVSTTNFEGRRVYLTSLTDGDYFGEQSFFTNQPRNANVEAMDPVLALEIAQDALSEVVREFPGVEDELRAFYKERIAESLLARSELFGHLAVRERKRLAAYFSYAHAKKGDLILREGDVSDAFYALRQGRVGVFSGGLDGATPVPLAELDPGEVFGEVAALKAAPRTASVRALSDCELLRIEASDLQAFLDANAEVRALIEEKIEARAADAIQRLVRE